MAMRLHMWDEWFVRCTSLIKGDVNIHIHTKWWQKKVSCIYVGQWREDGGSIMHRVDFKRLDDNFDTLLDLVSDEWIVIAPKVRKVCVCCSG